MELHLPCTRQTGQASSSPDTIYGIDMRSVRRENGWIADCQDMRASANQSPVTPTTVALSTSLTFNSNSLPPPAGFATPMVQDLPPQGGYEPVQYKVDETDRFLSQCLLTELTSSTAQPPRPRVPPWLLPPGHVRHHGLRLVQIHQRRQGTEVILPHYESRHAYLAVVVVIAGNGTSARLTVTLQ